MTDDDTILPYVNTRTKYVVHTILGAAQPEKTAYFLLGLCIGFADFTSHVSFMICSHLQCYTKVWRKSTKDNLRKKIDATCLCIYASASCIHEAFQYNFC